MTIRLSLHLTLALLCAASLLWKVPIPFSQFGLPIIGLSFHKFKCSKVAWQNALTYANSVSWWRPAFLSVHHLWVNSNQVWRAIHLPMRCMLYPARRQTEIPRSLWGNPLWWWWSRIFYRDNNSRWLLTKAQERLSSVWIFLHWKFTTHRAVGEVGG